MWFEFNEEEIAFREELKEFLDQELPDGWIGPNDESSDEGWDLYCHMRRKFADRGWLTMTWPKEYGGQEASPMISLLFAEEMSYRRAPGNDRFGTRMLGPTLMHFGTDEQKRKYLSDIAQGGIQWCQGYSEPNTGIGFSVIADLCRVARRRVRHQRLENLDIVGASRRHDVHARAD